MNDRAGMGTDLTEQLKQRREVRTDLLHWVWSCQLQIRRLAESTQLEWSLSDRSDLDQRRGSSRASLDEHLLAVVAGHFVTAMKAAREEIPGLQFDSEVLTLLRNIYEHWDGTREQFRNLLIEKNRSSKAFAEAHPMGRPWSVTYTADDTILADVVSIRQLSDLLDDVERDVLALENESDS